MGLDWLAQYSPMITHWGQHWIALQHGNELVVLHGEEGSSTIHANYTLPRKAMVLNLLF